MESSADTSIDDPSLRHFKSAQADRFRALQGTPELYHFKEAQADSLKAPYAPPQQPRSDSVDQPGTTTTDATRLLKLLNTDSRAEHDTRRLLHAALAQLDASSRALVQSDAERRALETQQLTRAAETLHAASAATQTAAAAQAELSELTLRMKAAQAEIAHTRDVMRGLEAQRDDAERVATRARALARRLHGEKLALLAKEEGRREGYEVGFGHGKTIAVAKEQQRAQRRRLEAEARARTQQRQIAAPPPPVGEPGGAFIEDRTSSGDDAARDTMARDLRDAPTRDHAPQADFSRDLRDARAHDLRQRRASLNALARPPVPATAQGDGAPEAIAIHSRTASTSSASTARRPVSTSSASTARRPPAVPAARTMSMGSSRAPSRLSSVTAEPVPAPSARDRARRSSVSLVDRDRDGDRDRGVSLVDPGPVARDRDIDRARRNSTASRASTARATAATQQPRRRETPASNVTSLDSLGLGTPRMMSVAPMYPRTIPMPPPPRPQQPPQPQPPAMAMGTAPQHVPMRPPPMPVPEPAFELEHPERRDTRTPSASSVSTSLRTLGLTSFPVGGGGGERERERGLSVIMEAATEGGSPSPAGSRSQSQLGSSWEAARQPTPWGASRGTASPYATPRGMDEWRLGAAGMTQDGDGGEMQVPRPLNSHGRDPRTSSTPGPGMLSPLDAMRQQIQEGPDLRRSSSGSSVNITIVPPTRPPSVGHGPSTSTLSGSGSGDRAGFLSPNDAADVPVVLEEDDEDDEDDEDEDEEEDSPRPPGFRMNPLPAFAQGVTFPPDFVPMSMSRAPGPQGAGPAPMGVMPAQQQQPFGRGPAPHSMGTNPGAFATEPGRALGQYGPASGPGPPLLGTHPGSFTAEPARPQSRMGGSNPGDAAWGPTRPLSRQGQGPPLLGTSPGSFTVEPARPPSRMGGSNSNDAAWGPAPLLGRQGQGQGPPLLGTTPGSFIVEPARPQSRMGGANPNDAAWGPARPPSRQGQGPPPLGTNPGSFTVEPARPRSRMGGGNPGEAWGPPRPPSRQGPPLLGTDPAAAAAAMGMGAPPFNVEPARPPSRMGGGGIHGAGPPGAPAWDAPVRPPSRQGLWPGADQPPAAATAGAFVVEPARPPSRIGAPGGANPAQVVWAAPPVFTPLDAQQPPRAPEAQGSNWTFGGQYEFGQNATPRTQPPPPLDIAGPGPPQPARPQPFGDEPSRSFTPRPPIYAAPAPMAAGFALPPSVASSTATNTTGTSHARRASAAGTTPAAAFAPRSLGGVSTARGRGTPANARDPWLGQPGASANLGIADPYNRAAEEDGGSMSSLGMDRMTMNNTLANAGMGVGGAVIPPSPAHSYRPMR